MPFSDYFVFPTVPKLSEMGSTPGGHRVLTSVCGPLCQLLPPPDFCAQALCLIFHKTLAPFLPIVSDLYERCTIVCPPYQVLEREAAADITPSNGTFTSQAVVGSRLLIEYNNSRCRCSQQELFCCSTSGAGSGRGSMQIQQRKWRTYTDA